MSIDNTISTNDVALQHSDIVIDTDSKVAGQMQAYLHRLRLRQIFSSAMFSLFVL